MCSPSSTVRKSGAECEMPEPCLNKTDAEFSRQRKQTWPFANPARFTLLDDGTGIEGTITVTSKFSNSGNPKAELKEKSRIRL